MVWWTVLVALTGGAFGWPMSAWMDRFGPAQAVAGSPSGSSPLRVAGDSDPVGTPDGARLTPAVRPADPGPRQAPRWRPPLLAGVAGLLSLAVALRVGWSWSLPAVLFLGLLGVLLSAIDLTWRRLPNALVLPSMPVLLVLLVPAAVASGDPTILLRAVAASAVLFVLYLIPALISPRSMGMGDVKLAALLGLPLGFLGWQAVLWGTFLAFAAGAAAAGWLLLTGRARRGSSMPFGPCMLAGAVGVVLLAAPSLPG